jgi:phenylalanyl-tRNA synthetase beta chain
MRTALLGSLLGAARANLSRDAERVALFESGRAYLPVDPPGGEFPGERPAPFHEPQRIACLAVGPLAPKSWRGGGEPVDFFALKGVLEGLAAQLGVATAELSVAAGDEPFLHPGRAARIAIGGEGAGWIGEVHPLVCREWDIEAAAAFELDLATLLATAGAGEEIFEDVTSFPAVNQDLSVVVPEGVSADDVVGRVVAAVEERGLTGVVRIFDRYIGEQIESGKFSLAVRLEVSAPDRTLDESDIAAVREAAEAKLAEIGGTLRG